MAGGHSQVRDISHKHTLLRRGFFRQAWNLVEVDLARALDTSCGRRANHVHTTDNDVERFCCRTFSSYCQSSARVGYPSAFSSFPPLCDFSIRWAVVVAEGKPTPPSPGRSWCSSPITSPCDTRPRYGKTVPSGSMSELVIPAASSVRRRCY